MPAITYNCIATTTVSGTSTNLVTFSSISASFTDLVLVCDGSLTAGATDIKIRFNSDSGSNYNRVYMGGNGSAGIYGKNPNLTGIYTMYWDTATSLSSSIVNIMNYSNSSTFKTVLGRNNTTNVSSAACLWRSTSAINRLDISPDANNFANGSVFSLYGIKAE